MYGVRISTYFPEASVCIITFLTFCCCSYSTIELPNIIDAFGIHGMELEDLVDYLVELRFPRDDTITLEGIDLPGLK